VRNRDHDALIVGGGHNGLVAAFYLARAGLRTLLLERRPFVGGACVTEEFAPGFRASSGAYVLSMLRPQVWRDMRLAARGVRVDAAGPTLNLFDDGSQLVLHDDLAPSVEEISRFSKADAASFPAFEERLERIGAAVGRLYDRTPVDPSRIRPRDAEESARLLGMLARDRRMLSETAFLFTTSASQYLEEHFESDQVRTTIGWHAINDSVHGPSSPGTAFVVLHEHVSTEVGGLRAWGFVRGGMGRVTEAMADAAREAGVEIRTDAEVERILVEGGRARGVALSGSGEVRADAVISNADPKRTFLRLLDPADLPAPFVAAIRAYRCEGTSMKINLAVGELPQLRGFPNGGVQPYHRGLVELGPFLPELDAQQGAARHGVPAQRPHVELCVPTVHDASLAPPGRHVVTIDVNSQPYTLAEGTWDEARDETADRVVARIGEFFPNLPGSVLHRQVLTPLDLERLLDLTGGHALHGEMTPDQLLFMRPARGYGDYRTPVEGLYLCGAGTHPGGGVTGANGRNCAREVLRDRRRMRSRRRLASAGRRITRGMR